MAATDQAIPQAIMPPGFYVCVCIRHPLKTASLNYRCTEKAVSLALTYDCKTSMFPPKTLCMLGMKLRTQKKWMAGTQQHFEWMAAAPRMRNCHLECWTL